MRRWTIALALAAALSLPIPSRADAPEEGEGDAGEAAAPAPAAAAGGEEAAEPEAAEESGEGAAEDSGEEAAEEEEEPGAWFEYYDSMRTRVLTGLNGIATAPADPVMATVDTPKALDKAGYARWPLGFASGALLMLYRTYLGAMDLVLAPIPAIPVLSPVPRYKLIPGFEHEDE
jgi:hypothetical protein